MLDPVHLSRMDQCQEFLVETIPPLMKRFYDKLLELGFNEVDSLELTKVYLASMSHSGSLF